MFQGCLLPTPCLAAVPELSYHLTSGSSLETLISHWLISKSDMGNGRCSKLVWVEKGKGQYSARSVDGPMVTATRGEDGDRMDVAEPA